MHPADNRKVCERYAGELPASGCKSAVDDLARNQEAACATHATLTNHADVYRAARIVANDAGWVSSTLIRSSLPRPMDGRQVSTLTMWVRVLLGAPDNLPGGGHSRASYAQRQRFESSRGGICVRGGIGIRTTLRSLAL